MMIAACGFGSLRPDMPSSSAPLTADVTREESDLLVSHAGGWVLLAMSLFWPRIVILGFWIFSDLVQARHMLFGR
jgi:hypothetical protein